MSVTRCPDCNKIISSRFSMHECKPKEPKENELLSGLRVCMKMHLISFTDNPSAGNYELLTNTMKEYQKEVK